MGIMKRVKNNGINGMSPSGPHGAVGEEENMDLGTIGNNGPLAPPLLEGRK